MAIADYFQRNAVAIAQAISGFDENRLASTLDEVCIGITIGQDTNCPEGRATLDLLVRLLARLYPAITLRSDNDSDLATVARTLATDINPRIELSGTPTVEIVLGTSTSKPYAKRRIFGASDGWDAYVSTSKSHKFGNSNNPFGPGAAACLVAATLFRQVFLSEAKLKQELHISCITNGDVIHYSPSIEGDLGDVALAGCGAIGNAVVWALARVDMTGSVSVIDHESIDLGNLQRYVWTKREDEKQSKAIFLKNKFNGRIKATAYECRLAEFLEIKRHRVDRLLLALDSKSDRCAAQASLPRWIANAWTQPNDLGVSTHDFMSGACVQCLYLPNGQSKNEDEIIAETLGVQNLLMHVRELLYSNNGTPRNFLEAIAETKQVALEKLLPFENRSLRTLYVEGFCGGAVISLDHIGSPPENVHVPLAHQSALAGILLAASLIQNAKNGSIGLSKVTQYDMLKQQGKFQTYPVVKDSREICICQDKDYRLSYEKKYSQPIAVEN